MAEELHKIQLGISRALESSRLDLVERILEAHESKPQAQRLLLTQSTDSRGNTCLHHAALCANLPLVKYLMDRGADIEAKGRSGETALHSAVRKGDLGVVQYLVGEKRADVTATNGSGATCLHVAAGQGNLPVVQYLLGEGDGERAAEMLGAKDKNGGTAAHYAAMRPDAAVLRFLVGEKGADMEVKTDDEHKTPLHIAALNGCLSVVQYLIEKAADCEAKDKRGMTALHLAAAKGRLATVKYLVEQCPRVNLEARDLEGATPLHVASRFNRLGVVQQLVEGGSGRRADVQAKDAQGQTALDIARSGNRKGIVEYLEKMECCQCHARVLRTAGLVCDHGHLVCDACLQAIDVEQLVSDRGNVPCPHKEEQGGAVACTSAAWSMEGVMPHLTAGVQVRLVNGLLQHLRLLEEGSQILAERLEQQEQETSFTIMENRRRQHEEATRYMAEKLKQVEERARQQEEAAARVVEEQRVQQYRLDILQHCLVPRWGPSAFYRSKRARLVANYLSKLSEGQEVKGRILESCSKDMQKLGISVEDVGRLLIGDTRSKVVDRGAMTPPVSS